MFTLRIQGLCLCVSEANEMLVCMLNSAYDPSLLLPYHMQTLVVEQKAVASSTGGQLKSLKGRMRGKNNPLDDDTQFIGWDLGSKTTLIDDGSAKAPAFVPSVIPAGTEDPGTAAGYQDPYWSLDIGKYASAAVMPDAKRIGPKTNALVSIVGGSVNAGLPQNGKDAEWVYDFGTFKQAVSDTLELTWATPPTVTIQHDASTVSTIRLAAGIGHLVNEASQIDNDNDVLAGKIMGLSEARHITGYHQALTAHPGALPTKHRRWGTLSGILEGTFCIILRA